MNTTKMLPTFLTGSYAYGKPGPDSDLDLAILADEHTYRVLCKLADRDNPRGPGSNDSEPDSHLPLSDSLRFGNLNVIVFTEPKLYQAWLDTNNQLVALAEKHGGVEREFAVERFGKNLRVAKEALRGGV